MAEFTLLNLHLRLSLHVVSIQFKSLLMDCIFRGRGSGFGLENKRAMIQANFSSNATMIGKSKTLLPGGCYFQLPVYSIKVSTKRCCYYVTSEIPQIKAPFTKVGIV